MTIEEKQIKHFEGQFIEFCGQCMYRSVCYNGFVSFLQKCQKEIRDEEIKMRSGRILGIDEELNQARAYERTRLREAALPMVEKFINKVETGRARSVETYEDMKKIKALLNS